MSVDKWRFCDSGEAPERLKKSVGKMGELMFVFFNTSLSADSYSFDASRICSLLMLQ